MASFLTDSSHTADLVANSGCLLLYPAGNILLGQGGEIQRSLICVAAIIYVLDFSWKTKV